MNNFSTNMKKIKVLLVFLYLATYMGVNIYASSYQRNIYRKNYIQEPVKILYQEKVEKGEPAILVFQSKIEEGDMHVYVGNEEVNFFNLHDNKYFFFINYDILSRKKRGNFKIQIANSKIGYRLDKNFNIYDKKVLKERIYLPKQYYDKDEKLIRRIKYLLSSYEYSKLQQIYKQTYNKFYDGKFVLPVKGKITSLFGNVRAYNGGSFNSYHKGLDIANRKSGTPIRASNNGLVILKESFYGRGKTLVIAHGHGIKSLYFHLSGFCVNEGDIVRKGQVIGYLGTTGFSTGPHLHWEMRIYKSPVNPEYFLETDLDKKFEKVVQN